ncbi:Protein kinase domain [Macleaya cordata]|uniref:Protein kinase domain n=1 Tax=Macleaya cordata TaxID=56857 RepID=A0A200PU30_MACCD|nr:Protein kinase domain [Macleaya cordata]
MTKPFNFLSNLKKPFKSFADKDTRKEEDLEKIAAQEQKLFSFETLSSATKDFHQSNKLGEGGFGPVYKGKLEDGREIAVKKLSRSSRQGKKEFMNEANLLARVQHRNIVSLLGYCAHGAEKLLVYEYLPHESLDKLLFMYRMRTVYSSDRHSNRREELDWKKRFDVIAGVAKGLVYLHEDCHITIIHRDIKASNILLDDKWVPKIADFGMARLFPEDETHINTRVAGTNGYMAPEYVMHGNLSARADVFSFGVVVLELISGQKNSTFNQDAESSCLLEWAWKLYKKGRSLEIIDPTLALIGEAIEQVKMCIQIGLLCCQADPTLRPQMRRVVVMLSKKPGSLEEPQRPGYPGSRYRRTSRSSHLGSSRPAASSSNAGSSGGSSSNTYVSTFNTNSATSTLTSPLPRPNGKQPIEE